MLFSWPLPSHVPAKVGLLTWSESVSVPDHPDTISAPRTLQLHPMRARRCVVQLTVLGFILVPIFTYNLWWLVIGYSLIMALVGAYESISRPAYTFKASMQADGAILQLARETLAVTLLRYPPGITAGSASHNHRSCKFPMPMMPFPAPVIAYKQEVWEGLHTTKTRPMGRPASAGAELTRRRRAGDVLGGAGLRAGQLLGVPDLRDAAGGADAPLVGRAVLHPHAGHAARQLHLRHQRRPHHPPGGTHLRCGGSCSGSHGGLMLGLGFEQRDSSVYKDFAGTAVERLAFLHFAGLCGDDDRILHCDHCAAGPRTCNNRVADSMALASL